MGGKGQKRGANSILESKLAGWIALCKFLGTLGGLTERSGWHRCAPFQGDGL